MITTRPPSAGYVRLYMLWGTMRQRCRNPNHPGYRYYGERGIDISPDWDEFEPFFDWAIANGWQIGLQIDRINNNKGYGPLNCRFVTSKQNCNNRRDNRWLTHDGLTATLSQWAEKQGVPRVALHRRLERGWSVEQALTLPLGARAPKGSPAPDNGGRTENDRGGRRRPGTAGIGPPVTHDEAISRALLAVTRAGGRGFRHEVGLFYDVRRQPHRIGTAGEPDIMGLTADGRALAVEVKSGPRAALTPEQRAFAKAWRARGGLFVEARYTETEDGDATIALALRGGPGSG